MKAVKRDIVLTLVFCLIGGAAALYVFVLAAGWWRLIPLAAIVLFVVGGVLEIRDTARSGRAAKAGGAS